MTTGENKKGIMDILIAGIPLPIYIGLLVIVFGLMLVGKLPKGMIGAFAVMMAFGGIFNVIGNKTPIVKTYLGGGAIVCIFASAALVYFKVIPEEVVENVNAFMNTTGFLNFYIAALITGSILGMSRELLLKASVRFLPVALIAMTMAILLVGVVGMLVGYGFVESVMFIAVPMMGGGMGAGVVPLSGMYAEALPYTAEEILAKWSDREYLNRLIDQYWFLTDDILDEDIMYPLEGYLYADTYFVTSDVSDIEGFTEMCLDSMQEALDARRDEIESSKFSVHELLTLTSIVTKEAQAEDQAGVAGVFMNRLDKNMSLGSDVTVCYIFQEDRVDLYESQLDSDNPYNTRKFAGLPPGPICQVVGDAIDAVLHPDSNDYIFFYAGPDGTVYYATTQAEHESNIEAHPWTEEDLAG